MKITEEQIDKLLSIEPPKYPPLLEIRSARKAKKITASELAEKIGIDFVAYIKMENGRLFPPQEILLKIADVLQLKNVED